jgi:hypothetical protein
VPNQENDDKYQYVTYIAKHNSVDQRLYLLYNHNLKSDILLAFFEIKSLMIYS